MLLFAAIACAVVAGVGASSLFGERMRITLVGDLMLGDAAQERLDREGYDWPFAGVAALLPSDSYVVANAEAPIADLSEPFDEDQRWHYNSLPPAAHAYAAAGIDALGLANNHVMDRGADGLLDTIRHADTAGMATVGAGPTVAEAERPLLIESDAGTVAVVALSEGYGDERTATEHGPGSIPADDVSIRRGYELAKADGAEWVVGYVHWGENYSDVTDDQLDLAVAFANAGYDLLVGHHPHVVQRIGFVGRMPVVYSIGNFVFQTPGRFDKESPGYGLVLTAEFGNSSLARLVFRCIVTDNERVQFAPQPCDPREAADVLRGLHRDVILVGDVGWLELPAN